MKYGVNVSSNQNLIALNCTIFKVNLSTNEMNCVESGLVLTNTYSNIINGVNDYHLDYFQFGSEKTFVFRTQYSDDFSAKSDLSCSKSCIFGHNTETGVTRRISPYSYEGERFFALGDGNIIWSGMETNGNYDPNASYDSEILLTDLEGNTIELSSSPNNVLQEIFKERFQNCFWGRCSK